MKKRVFYLFILILISQYALGQEESHEKKHEHEKRLKRKHEISAGYGVGTDGLFLNRLNDIQVTNTLTGINAGSKTYSGAFQAGYKYSVNKKIDLGVGFAYEWASSSAFHNREKVGELSNNYYSFGAEMNYVYSRIQGFKCYGMVGIGATIYSQEYKSDNGLKDNTNLTNINFQINPVCIRYGDKVGFFGEIGFGYRGLLNCGIFARF